MSAKRGLVIVNTGPGKGKTTAALGTAVRASGQGLRVLMLQFIKGGSRYGELDGAKHLPGVEIRPLGLGLVMPGQDRSAHQAEARAAWAECLRVVSAAEHDLIILDEICVAVHFGFVSAQEVVELINSKPPEMHLILTGRNCPEEIMAAADTVTVMEEVKHHFAAGVKAQAGIEF